MLVWGPITQGRTSEQIFTEIYEHNGWGGEESRSGLGSELSYTEELRHKLPILLTQFGVTRILDAPCGDFNWMQHVVPRLGIEYIGGDIVKDMVVRNQQRFGTSRISFRHLDIVKDPLPASDLMMVRDCLFHLSHDDIFTFLENFCSSDIDLLLTTTHLPADGDNYDVSTGGFRFIHLFSPPFFFPHPPLFRIEDWVPPYPEREMCLFSKPQVEVAREAMKRFMNCNRG